MIEDDEDYSKILDTLPLLEQSYLKTMGELVYRKHFSKKRLQEHIDWLAKTGKMLTIKQLVESTGLRRTVILRELKSLQNMELVDKTKVSNKNYYFRII